MIDLIEIYQKAWDITKKNKPLWVIGMAVAIFSASSGSLYNSYNNYSKLSNLSDMKGGKTDFSAFEPAKTYFLDIVSSVPIYLWVLLAGSFLVALVAGIIFTITVKSWARAALISGIDMAANGGKPSLRDSAKGGFRNLKSMIWLNFVPLAFFILVFLLFGLIILLGFAISKDLGSLLFIVVGIPAVFIFVLGTLAISMVLIWAYRVSVIEGKSGKESFMEGIRLTRQYFLDTVVLGIFNSILGCFTVCGVIMVGGLVMLFLTGMFLLNDSVGIAFAILALAIFFPLLIFAVLFKGIYIVFNYSTWNLLYSRKKTENER